MKDFRNHHPQRSQVPHKSDYRKYKDHLRTDFQEKCGYCDDHDFFCGGKRGYHIDHFKPQHHFSTLITDYNNLVYCCPYCNNGKSCKWPSHVNLIDPVDTDYNKHFCRNNDGEIIYKTTVAQYMYIEFKLYLKRHSIIWKMEIIEGLLNELENEIKSNGKIISDLRHRLLEQYFILSSEQKKMKNELLAL